MGQLHRQYQGWPLAGCLHQLYRYLRHERSTWSSGYDANAGSYVRNDLLATALAGKTRSAEWADPALASLFSLSSPSSTPKPKAGIGSNSSSSNGVVIGGAVVGVLAAFAILGIIGWFLHRRRRRARTGFGRGEEKHLYPQELDGAPAQHELDSRQKPAELSARKGDVWELSSTNLSDGR